MKIECTLPNASEEISGIPFSRSATGTMVSVHDVPPQAAARLLRIEGFRQYEERDPKNEEQAEKARQEAERAKAAAESEAAAKAAAESEATPKAATPKSTAKR